MRRRYLMQKAHADPLSWELNTKMLPTVWQGIAQSTLTQLTVKFPSTRHPQPITVAPPIPNLKMLKILDIDPLCYADDISLLLAGSKKLEDLRLHWSPRMKECREPSVNLGMYFGKVTGSDYEMPLKRLSIQNLYTHNDGSCGDIVHFAGVQELTLINSTAGEGDEAADVFIDRRWRVDETLKYGVLALKMLRIDKTSKRQCEFLGSFTGLERLYFIGTYKNTKNESNSVSRQESNTALLPNSPASSTSSSVGDASGLKDDYLESITMNHGSTLRHLLLLPQWRLTADNIALIIRNCPNLEQLGLGVDFADVHHLRLLIPFLPKLKALRLLDNPDDRSFGDQAREKDNGSHEEKLGTATLNAKQHFLKYLELAGLVFEMGQVRLHGPVGENGKQQARRDVWKRSLDTVRDIDIWRMDTHEI